MVEACSLNLTSPKPVLKASPTVILQWLVVSLQGWDNEKACQAGLYQCGSIVNLLHMTLAGDSLTDTQYPSSGPGLVGLLYNAASTETLRRCIFEIYRMTKEPLHIMPFEHCNGTRLSVVEMRSVKLANYANSVRLCWG